MSSSLSILADENIPWVHEAFASLGSVTTMPGRAMTARTVQDMDVLLVRSVTQVNQHLLQDSRVQFVGSATIGTDHIDKPYLAEHGITFAHAPGSNADSVVEYVIAALLQLAVRKNEPIRDKTIGIVGCGNIGSRLAKRMPALGLRTLLNDPPLAEQASTTPSYVALDHVLEEADIISLHVPLTHNGPHPTHHLFDADRLRTMRSDIWLCNTCRGPVIDNAALCKRLGSDPLHGVVLDVWETEPQLDTTLLNQVNLGTPHIAGYSYDGKVTGTVMLYEALLAHLNQTPLWDAASIYAPTPDDEVLLNPPPHDLPEHQWLHQLVREMYPIAEDDGRLRTVLDLAPGNQGAHFTRLRKTYPRRRTFSLHQLAAANIPSAYVDAVRHGLGVQIV